MDLTPEMLRKRLPPEPGQELLMVLRKAVREPFQTAATTPGFLKDLGGHVGRAAVSGEEDTPGGPRVQLAMQALAVLALHDELTAEPGRERERQAWRGPATAVLEELQTEMAAAGSMPLLTDRQPTPTTGEDAKDRADPRIEAPSYTGPVAPRWIVNPVRPTPPEAEATVAHARRWATRTRFVPDDTFDTPLAVETGLSRRVGVVRVVDRTTTEAREGEGWRSLRRASSFAMPKPQVAQADREFLVDDSVRQVQCHKCAGAGTLRCSTCVGQGTRACERRQTCNSCFGSGRRGRERCTTCLGDGAVVCRKCQGRGSLRCGTCGGDGAGQCRRCAGNGRVTQYSIYRWQRLLHQEGEETLGRVLPTEADDWQRVLSCPVDEASDHLLDDELVTLHRLIQRRPDDPPRDNVFAVVDALPWGVVQTKARRSGDESVTTYVFGADTPRVASPVIEGDAWKKHWGAVLTGLTVLALVVVLAVVMINR